MEIEMRGTVRKWGNSAAVRLPTSIMQAARLQLDAEIEVREEDGRIVIEPVRPSETSLNGLLDQITEANIHEEVDYGGPIGREAL